MKAFEVPTGLLKVLLSLAIEVVIPHFIAPNRSIVLSVYFNFMK